VSQASTPSERTVPDVGNAVGNGDVNQGAPNYTLVTDFAERRDSNAGDAVANRDVSQASTTGEGGVPDAGHAVGDGIGGSGFSRRILDKRRLAFVEQNAADAAVILIS